MGSLNQYSISQALGSKMKPVKEARFGNFGLLETTAEALRARESAEPSSGAAFFTYAEDRVIVKAFESVRQGAAPDAILWNTALAPQVSANVAARWALTHRMLSSAVAYSTCVTKNKKRYEKHGIRIAPATARDPRPSILPHYAHIIDCTGSTAVPIRAPPLMTSSSTPCSVSNLRAWRWASPLNSRRRTHAFKHSACESRDFWRKRTSEFSSR